MRRLLVVAATLTLALGLHLELLQTVAWTTMLVGLRVGWGDERRQVFLEMRNLLDEDHLATHGIRDNASANDAILHPGEPLSLYAGAEISW